jgi:uncharacterized protein YegP (UPF0339 family)
MARFQVRRNKLTRRFRVVLTGDNNEPLSTSETLNSREAVETNIAAQRKAAPDATVEWAN